MEMITITGRTVTFGLIDGKVVVSGDFCAFDIANALSRIPRWGGHAFRFYSVASHSIACYYEALRVTTCPHTRMWALMHDATEAYLGDVITPLKKMLPSYSEVEFNLAIRILMSVCKEYDWGNVDQKAVKLIDRRMLVNESVALANSEHKGRLSELFDETIFQNINKTTDSFGYQAEEFLRLFQMAKWEIKNARAYQLV